jgi:hypothetical protein
MRAHNKQVRPKFICGECNAAHSSAHVEPGAAIKTIGSHGYCKCIQQSSRLLLDRNKSICAIVVDDVDDLESCVMLFGQQRGATQSPVRACRS